MKSSGGDASRWKDHPGPVFSGRGLGMCQRHTGGQRAGANDTWMTCESERGRAWPDGVGCAGHHSDLIIYSEEQRSYGDILQSQRVTFRFKGSLQLPP